tara:strand:+ start:381 stop:599 length:219 start_codon:yes stop_codon:yes gene_type:complete
MVETFVLGLMALVYGESHEFISRTREFIEKGYTWEYVGYTEVEYPPKSPSIIINRETNPHVYWKLRKPKNVK